MMNAKWHQLAESIYARPTKAAVVAIAVACLAGVYQEAGRKGIELACAGMSDAQLLGLPPNQSICTGVDCSCTPGSEVVAQRP
ncbi:MAG: hypothetical protein AAF493_14905 [Pseudomonadota bacterium]